YPYNVTFSPEALGNYTLTARAVDTAGNITVSAPINVMVALDMGAPPSIEFTTPNAGATYAIGQTIALNTVATLGEAGTIASVDFFVNGDPIQTLTTPSSGQGTAPFYRVDWTPAAVGNYEFTAVVTDSRGRVGFAPAVNISVAAVVP